jgi:glycosyltransferase involved in cell wall biosynthesis
VKVVLASHHYPPDNTAGVELIVERAACWLVRKGYTVEVVCVGKIDSPTHLAVQSDERDGVLVHRLGLKLWGQGIHLGLRYRDEAVRAWLEDYFERARPDLVHSQSSYLLTASAIEAAKGCGIPVVVSLNDYWFTCPRITLLRSNGAICSPPVSAATCTWCLMAERRRYHALDRVATKLGSRARSILPVDPGLLAQIEDRRAYLDRVLRTVDRIITPGLVAYDQLMAAGFSAEQIQLVRSGLDVSHWTAAPRREGVAPFRVGYLGQLAPHKGVAVLVQAFQKLRPGVTPPELRIYGDARSFPQYAAALQKAAAGNPRIQFLGRYDNREVGNILADLDVLVVPSLWHEVSPLVIKEAFAAGVPVVASDLRNLAFQVSNEVDGLLFAAGDASDLARQLERLIDEPPLRRRLAAGVRPPPTLDDEMSDVEDVYRRVLGGSATPKVASFSGGDRS